MSELQGQIGELRMTLEITRKETGKTETVELVGHSDPAELERIMKEIGNGSNPLDSGA